MNKYFLLILDMCFINTHFTFSLAVNKQWVESIPLRVNVIGMKINMPFCIFIIIIIITSSTCIVYVCVFATRRMYLNDKMKTNTKLSCYCIICVCVSVGKYL